MYRSSNNIVWTERIDYLTFKDKSKGTLPLPVVGVMEMKDGKIHHWRDCALASAIRLLSGLILLNQTWMLGRSRRQLASPCNRETRQHESGKLGSMSGLQIRPNEVPGLRRSAAAKRGEPICVIEAARHFATRHRIGVHIAAIVYRTMECEGHSQSQTKPIALSTI